jgi:hypothetical protein
MHDSVRRVKIRRVAAASFATCLVTDDGKLFTAGDATDGQCGLGKRSPKYAIRYVEEHRARTAMQVRFGFESIRRH